MGKKAFTLIELVISTGVFLITILGILAVYDHSILLSRYSESSSLALQSAQGKLEEMKSYLSNHTLAQLQVDYGLGGNPGNAFDPLGLTGKGGILFDASNPAAVGVKVVISWTEKGRLFGEDRNQNGRFDAGDDNLDGNNELDSPVQLETTFIEEI